MAQSSGSKEMQYKTRVWMSIDDDFRINTNYFL